MEKCQIKEIQTLCFRITDSKLEALRLEEELLLNLVKCKKISLKIKKEAFVRVTDINRQQLKLIGSTINKA